MENQKWGFIINPIAGAGYAAGMENKVAEQIAKHNLDADISITTQRGHATELAKTYASNGFTHVVAVGGDGTINEVANGVMDFDNVILGVVSAGSGNDFIQILGFSEHFTDEDWDVFFQQNITKMDVGNCNGHYFLNGLGLGFDAQVAAENHKSGGDNQTGNYLWHILKTLVFFREKFMDIHANGHSSTETCFMNTVAIGRRFAAAYYLTPNAIANDGLLDVCHVQSLNFFQRLNLFLKAPTGKHIEHPKVNYYQTDRIEIEFDQKVPHHLDGELFFAKKYNVEILPQKLGVIYNPLKPNFLNI